MIIWKNNIDKKRRRKWGKRTQRNKMIKKSKKREKKNQNGKAGR